MKPMLIFVLMLAALPAVAQSSDSGGVQQAEAAGQSTDSSLAVADRLDRIADLREQRRDLSRQIRTELRQLPASERPRSVKRRADRVQLRHRHSLSLRRGPMTRLHHHAFGSFRNRF